MIKKLTSVATAVSALALSAMPVFANGLPPNPISKCSDAGNPAVCLIGLVLSFILGIAAAVALLFLAIGGIQYMSSGGDKVAVESARGRITSAVTGLVIVFGAWLVIKVICTMLGVECGL